MTRVVSGALAALLTLVATLALAGTAAADPAPVCPPGYQVMPGTNYCMPGAPSQNGQLPPTEPTLGR